jgi:hypothetical protein
MGKVVKFKRPPQNRDQFRGQGGWKPTPKATKLSKLRAGFRAFVGKALPMTILLGLAVLWWGIDKARGVIGQPAIPMSPSAIAR